MAYQDTTQDRECQVNIGSALVANSQSAELVQPTDRPLDHPTEDAQLAAVVGISLGDVRLHAALRQLFSMRVGVVGAVCKQFLRALQGMANLASDRRNAVNQLTSQIGKATSSAVTANTPQKTAGDGED